MAISPVDLAGPYLAVLSMLKLVLLILVFSEIAKALGKGGDEVDDDSGPIKRRNRDPEEIDKIELEIVAPAAPARSTNEAAKIPRKVEKFIAKSTKVDIPPRCRHVWFITTQHNQIGLFDVLNPNHGVFYGIGGNRNLVILKNIKISDKIPSNEEVGLHVRLLTPNRKKILGEGFRKIMIVDGPGTGPKPTKKRFGSTPSWKLPDNESTESFIGDVLTKNKIHKSFKGYWRRMENLIKLLEAHKNPQNTNLFNQLEEQERNVFHLWRIFNDRWNHLRGDLDRIAENAGFKKGSNHWMNGDEISAHHKSIRSNPELLKNYDIAINVFSDLRRYYTNALLQMQQLSQTIDQIKATIPKK